jgi:hypothetical protein
VDGYSTSLWCAQDDGERYPNDEATNCNGAVTDAITNSPELQMAGVRCTYADNLRYIYGLAEVEGATDALGNPTPMAAPFPWDNVGVQYGLKAFNDGLIDFDHFADLNANIGGLDINGSPTGDRTAADPAVVQIAYETGRINTGENLGDIPILDIRRWRDLPRAVDNPNNLDVHDAVHTRAMELRLIAANGDAINQVIITTIDGPQNVGSPQGVAMARGVAQLDEWLTAIAAAEAADGQVFGTRHELVNATKPADFVDACYPVTDLKVTDLALCNQLFPIHAHPRLIAGGPGTEDIIKCELKEVDAADYSAQLSAEQLNRLREIFPEGVCDWSKPGVGQVAMLGTWLAYDGMGGWTVGVPRT